MIEFRIRPKSFIGLLFGCLVGLVGMWVSFQFNLSPKQVFVGGFILFTFIGFLPLIFSRSDYERNLKKIDSLKEQLLKIEDESKRKVILLKKSTKIIFDSYELRELIKLSKINDDQFWIDFYISNITRYKFYESYFFDFISNFNSKESKRKLEDIFINRGWLKKRVPLNDELYKELLENLKKRSFRNNE